MQAHAAARLLRSAPHALALSCAASAIAQSCPTFLIEIEGHGPGQGTHLEFVHDPSRNFLFITTPQGALDRFNLNTRTLLPRWNVGVWPHGVDITPDFASLIIAEEHRQTGFAGKLLRVNADTGAVTIIPLGPTGNWDVVVTADNRAFVTPTQSGVNPAEERLREINLTTLLWRDRTDITFAAASGRIEPQTTLHPSPDRARFFAQEANSDNWRTAQWSQTTDTFTGVGQRYTAAAYNHDASRLAVVHAGQFGQDTVHILDQAGSIVASLPFGGNTRAVIFDPVRPRLYITLRGTDELLTVDTATWAPLARTRFPGLDFDGATSIAIAHDGSLLFVKTEMGVGAIELSESLCRCLPDITTTGAVVPSQTNFAVPDGVLNNDDFFCYLTHVALHSGCSTGNCPSPPDLTTTGAVSPGSPGFGIPDGLFNNDDFFYYLTVFAAGC